MTEISVHRLWNFFGCARKLKVRVDGVVIGAVKAGKTEVFEVTAAIHAVQVSMDWVKSPALEVDLRLERRADVEVRFASIPESLVYTFFAPAKIFTLVQLFDLPPIQNSVSPYPRAQ